jgi:hypothetical protein
MERIKTPTRVPDKWPGGPHGPRDGFTDGSDPNAPPPIISSTQCEARFFDSLQEEVSTAIELAGIQLRDGYPYDQLFEAIRAIAIANNPDLGAFVLRAGDNMTGPLGITSGGPQLSLINNAGDQSRVQFHATTSQWWLGIDPVIPPATTGEFFIHDQAAGMTRLRINTAGDAVFNHAGPGSNEFARFSSSRLLINGGNSRVSPFSIRPETLPKAPFISRIRPFGWGSA